MGGGSLARPLSEAVDGAACGEQLIFDVAWDRCFIAGDRDACRQPRFGLREPNGGAVLGGELRQ
jgi:hypothetical protein